MGFNFHFGAKVQIGPDVAQKRSSIWPHRRPPRIRQMSSKGWTWRPCTRAPSPWTPRVLLSAMCPRLPQRGGASERPARAPPFSSLTSPPPLPFSPRTRRTRPRHGHGRHCRTVVLPPQLLPCSPSVPIKCTTMSAFPHSILACACCHQIRRGWAVVAQLRRRATSSRGRDTSDRYRVN
jgi:hypothetical protein